MDKETLRQYRRLKAEIELLQAEKDELVKSCIGAVSLDGLPKGSKPGDLTAEAAARMWAVAEKMADRLNELVSLRAEIEEAIESLPESRDRQLMRLRYIEGRKWEQIAVELNYDYRWVLKLHGQILLRLKRGH